ncbi:MAG TPA: riboflavin biosynthesis protein RibF, partial [Parasegetibacter sp.]
FDPHPRKIVPSAAPVALLTTLNEKIRLLEESGVDHLVVVPFTTEFSQLSAAEYIESFLIKKFCPHTLIIGYDHRFGKGRAGDFRLMEEYSAKHGFCLIEIPEQDLNEMAISSTRIRKALLEGKISEANQLLGHAYFLEGVVVEGNKIGRTIGYPTANIDPETDEKLVPANGVYVVSVNLETDNFQHTWKGMMNIGTRPTVNGTNRTIEVNILDFDQDIYGKRIRVNFLQFIRNEEKLSGLEELKEYIGKDKVFTLEWFARQQQ